MILNLLLTQHIFLILMFFIPAELVPPTNNGPPQPRGVFSCRIEGCVEKLPVCRMLNHVRTFHMDNLTEVSDMMTIIDNLIENNHFSVILEPVDGYRR